MRYLARFWFNLPIRYKGAAVVFLPVLGLTALVLWIGAQFRFGRDMNLRLQEAHEVRLEGQRLLSAVLEVETGVRGYLLTRRPEFLEPYRQAGETIPTSLAHLRALAREPEQQFRIRGLETTIRDRLVVLEGTRAAGTRASASEPARLQEILARGKLLMD